MYYFIVSIGQKYVDGFSALGFTLPKSKCKPVGLFLGGSGKSLLSRSFRWLTESSFLWL